MIQGNLRLTIWRGLNSERQLPKIIEGVRFIAGIEVIEALSQNAA